MRYRTLALIVTTALVACGPLQPATSTPPGRVVALVQIENSAASDPHSGLQKADVVYEYLAEGGITRFTVIYYDPRQAGRVGPVRSIRPIALRLRQAYGGVMFFSGGSQPLMDQVKSQDVPSVSEQAQGDRYFRRDPTRPAPHNLFTSGADLSTALQAVSGTSTYSPSTPGSLPSGGRPAGSLTFQQTATHSVSYSYSAAHQGYAYSSERGPLVDAANGGQVVEVTNVVLLEAPHKDYGYTDVLGAPVVDFDLSGGGKALVFGGSKRYEARWQPLSPGRPLTLLASDGRDLSLPAGLTWVHVIDPGTRVEAG
jgi:hypothetical protein